LVQLRFLIHISTTTIAGNIVAAFDMHQQTFGHLDICVNNAGIGDVKSFLDDRSVDGKGSWRKTVDINLTAVIDGTRIAVQAMEGRGGVIVNVASAAGLYPSSSQPIYSASKAGVVMFTRSLSKLKAKGIRVNALCPEVPLPVTLG
jgi:NAD(P)-dependent dehydrogenase (short-subunit alcohol dehydrogenase family)